MGHSSLGTACIYAPCSRKNLNGPCTPKICQDLEMLDTARNCNLTRSAEVGPGGRQDWESISPLAWAMVDMAPLLNFRVHARASRGARGAATRSRTLSDNGLGWQNSCWQGMRLMAGNWVLVELVGSMLWPDCILGILSYS